MTGFLQSRIGVVAIFSIVVFFSVIAWKVGVPSIEHDTRNTAEKELLAAQHLDSDGDSLPDWQEHLIGTDPHRVDTDGDGVPDSATPLSALDAATTIATSSEESSLSTAVAQNFLAGYFDLKGEGYTPEKAAKLGAELANTISTSTAYTEYTLADILITSDASYDAMLKYRAELRIALEPLLENTTPEFELYGRVIASGDSAALTELSTTADRYLKAAENMMSVKVPEEGRLSHLAAANSLVHFGAVVHEMVRAIHDPIASAALIREYNGAERDVFNAFNAQANYFATKHREHISYEN